MLHGKIRLMSWINSHLHRAHYVFWVDYVSCARLMLCSPLSSKCLGSSFLVGSRISISYTRDRQHHVHSPASNTNGCNGCPDLIDLTRSILAHGFSSTPQEYVSRARAAAATGTGYAAIASLLMLEVRCVLWCPMGIHCGTVNTQF